MSDAATIQAAAVVLMDAVLRLLQADPHRWSTRPCSTCHAITAILDKPFGCTLYALQEGARNRAERAGMAVLAEPPG